MKVVIIGLFIHALSITAACGAAADASAVAASIIGVSLVTTDSPGFTLRALTHAQQPKHWQQLPQ